MMLEPAESFGFPRLREYLTISLPTVIHVSTIVRNMERFGSLDREALRIALMPGTLPLVRIRDLPPGSCGRESALGCFDHAAPNQIELDRQMVQDFEDDPTGIGSSLTKAGKPVFVVGVTVLHELCHWGNKRAVKPEPFEMGDAFERLTYGRRIAGATRVVF